MASKDRRNQLLETATALILSHGVAAMSMERLALEAGVSKALPYKHFENTEAVLSFLYQRETRALGKQVWKALSEAEPDEDLIRVGISTYFDEIVSRGPVLAALSKPGSTIAAVADPDQAGVIFEVEVLSTFHGVSRPRAKAIAGLIQGAVVGAASTLRQGHAGRSELEDDLVSVMRAAIGRQAN